MTTTRAECAAPPFAPGNPATARELSDDELVAFWHHISSAVRQVQRRIDRSVADMGVPAQWIGVLQALLHATDHHLQMTALARDLSMTTGGFTKLADRMVSAGLISRHPSPDDRRVVNAMLTTSGLVMARKSARAYREAVRSQVVTAGVGPLDVAATAATLRALSRGRR